MLILQFTITQSVNQLKTTPECYFSACSPCSHDDCFVLLVLVNSQKTDSVWCLVRFTVLRAMHHTMI